MTTSDESADTSLQLVLEFLAAKGLHSAAAALRAEVSTVGLTPASRSKLERLVAGAGAAGEAEEPDPLATDGLSLAPLAEPNDGSSAPRFYQPSGDPSQDGWDDDDDLGYERVFTHEVLSSPASTSGGSPVVTERPGFESYERVDEWAAPRASPGDGTQGSDGPPDDFPPVGGPHTTFLPVARSSAVAGAEGSEEEEADAAAQFGARRAAGVSPGLPKRRTPTKEEGGKAAAEEEAGRSGGEEEGTAECGVGWAVKDEEEHAASVALAASLHRILAIRASAGERGAPAGLAGAEVERGEADARSAAKTVVHTSGVHGSDEEEEEEGEEEGGADGGANTAGGRSSSRKSSVRVSGSVEIVGNLTSGSRGSSCSYSTRGSSPTTSPVHGALARPGSGGGQSSDGDEAPEGPPRMKRNLTGLPPPPDSEEEEEGEGEGEGGEEEGEEEVEESDPETDPLERMRAAEALHETLHLRVVHERARTGFEENKNFPVRLHSLIASRYQVKEYLGSAAFSKAVQCLDLHTGEMVCIKIIKNNKDFFDQSLDEIKLLRYLRRHDPNDEHHVLRMYDYFYYKEHLFIVCELLRDNLYEFSRFNRDSGAEPYFTLPRLRKVTKQCLEALVFVHRLGLIHCDLKPENILIKSYSRCEVKVIDFGSSCFTSDHLSSYVQSRSYRAPEVVLGLPYDTKIDLWSLGAIIAELHTGYVLFQNDSLAAMLARIVGILGPFPHKMLARGRHTHKFFRNGDVFEREQGKTYLLHPKVSPLRHRLHTDDELFISFVGSLLQLDPAERPSAAQALRHPWIATDPYASQ